MKLGRFELSLSSGKQQVNEMVSNGISLMSMSGFILAYEAMLGNSYANKYITKEQQVRETNLKYRGESLKGICSSTITINGSSRTLNAAHGKCCSKPDMPEI